MSLTTVGAAPVPTLMPYAEGDPRSHELDFMMEGPPGDRIWRRMDRDGRRMRRRATRESPMAFACVYLRGAMDPVYPMRADGEVDLTAQPVISFSAFHRAICEEAKNWVTPNGRRTGIIASRGGGKSWWQFLALPIWAIAHGHRRYFYGYANTDDQAIQQLGILRHQLKTNDRLIFDYPELALLKGGLDNKHQIEVACQKSARELEWMALRPEEVRQGVAMFSTGGIDKVSLGARSKENVRPDAVVIDDGEPNETGYAQLGKDAKDNRLKSIRDIILPMEPRAVVLLSGTVTMPGSIAHDLVKRAMDEPTAAWVTEERFKALYFNAILDEDTERERSVWPQKWPLEFLKAERDRNPAQYALHYANQPLNRNGQYWQGSDFKYGPVHFPQERFVMYVDPAETTKSTSDYTGIVVVGTDIGRHRAVVKVAKQGRLGDVALGHLIADYKRRHPEIPVLEVYVEGYGSKDLRYQTLKQYMPAGVKLEMERPNPELGPSGERGKPARVANAYSFYEGTGRVWHERPFPELESMLTSYPRVNHDDVIDALASALRLALRQ